MNSMQQGNLEPGICSHETIEVGVSGAPNQLNDGQK